MPHHYQINSHWFNFAVHYNPLISHPLAMSERLDPLQPITGQHSRSWRWPRATLANFGVAQKLGPQMLEALTVRVGLLYVARALARAREHLARFVCTFSGLRG